jgi:hypothetical protein
MLINYSAEHAPKVRKQEMVYTTVLPQCHVALIGELEERMQKVSGRTDQYHGDMFEEHVLSHLRAIW